MYAVITGASSGFGKEFARQFSILGMCQYSCRVK